MLKNIGLSTELVFIVLYLYLFKVFLNESNYFCSIQQIHRQVAHLMSYQLIYPVYP